MRSTVRTLDESLCHVLTKFRMRGTKRVELEGRAIMPLMLNALRNNERMLEGSSEPLDREAAERARQMRQELQDREVKEMVRRVLPNPPEGELGDLYIALVSILAGFRIRGRILTETKEFKNLVDMIYEKYPE